MSAIPKASIVMSVYNGEKYLEDAINSILRQTFEDFDFVIIDDGSDDGTLKILEDYKHRDERIRVFHQQNMGLTRSLNRGIRLSKGQYIARIDADDISLPERLGRQVEFLDEHPEVGLAGTAFIVRDEIKGKQYQQFPPCSDGEIRRTLPKYNPFAHSTVMIRRSALDKVGLYNEDFMRRQDRELWARIGRYFQMHIIQEILAVLRVHRDQWARDKSLLLSLSARIKSIRELSLPLHFYIYPALYSIYSIVPVRLRPGLRRVIREKT